MKTTNEALKLVKEIAEKINELNGRSFFVGGCVRDKLLNR